MPKVIIIGGGISGLSVAHSLSKSKLFHIQIHERNRDIGGQAISSFGEHCYNEYSWRIFGRGYINFFNVMYEINNLHNFVPMSTPCFITDKQQNSNNLRPWDLFTLLVKEKVPINKLLNIGILSKDRLLNDYHDVYAYEYFDKHPIIVAINGPVLGMEAKKVSLSGMMKNSYNVLFNNNKHVSSTMITKGPTNISVFDHWKRHLISNGVDINTESHLQKINTANNKITSVVINGHEHTADYYVFACSLESLVNIATQNHILSQTNTIHNLYRLTSVGLQLYFTFNLYFTQPMGGDQCTEFVLVDTKWQLIIQKKRQWSAHIMSRCDALIKDVWNIGLLDYCMGHNGKILQDCSIQEAITEGIYQLKNSNYMKQLLGNESFDSKILGYDYYHEFVDIDGKVRSLNPKFSTNVGSHHLQPKTSHPHDLPSNMFLSAYYVENTIGGASMESACTIGLTCANDIRKLEQLNQEHVYDHAEGSSYLTPLLAPLNLLDQGLYKTGLPPITEYVRSEFIILLYLIFIVYMAIGCYEWVANKCRYTHTQ